MFVRSLTEAERNEVRAGLRSPDAFTFRRCQIVLASARGERAPQISRALGCSDQCVRNALAACNAHGVGALIQGSPRPHTPAAAFGPEAAERLRALLHQSPRLFGLPTSLWTLELVAQVSFAEGLTPPAVGREAVRTALARLGVKWKRAKHWITSPDPAYERKKGPATA
jgi:transposase